MLIPTLDEIVKGYWKMLEEKEAQTVVPNSGVANTSLDGFIAQASNEWWTQVTVIR